MSDFKPLYRYSFTESLRHDEADKWKDSQAENIRCRDYIDSLISEHFDGLHLRGDIAKKAVSEFGHDRTQWVLANTIQHYENDSRISPANKAWAMGIFIARPQKLEQRNGSHSRDYNLDYLLKSHTGLVDMVARDALKLYADLNLYSHKHCEPGDIHTMSFEGKLLAIRDTVLKESCRTPENQLFYAQSGFGCSPGSSGRAVFGQFLIDGEKTRFNREDFCGIVDENYVPEWATVKMHDLQSAEAPGEAKEQSMSGLKGM